MLKDAVNIGFARSPDSGPYGARFSPMALQGIPQARGRGRLSETVDRTGAADCLPGRRKTPEARAIARPGSLCRLPAKEAVGASSRRSPPKKTGTRHAARSPFISRARTASVRGLPTGSLAAGSGRQGAVLLQTAAHDLSVALFWVPGAAHLRTRREARNGDTDEEVLGNEGAERLVLDA